MKIDSRLITANIIAAALALSFYMMPVPFAPLSPSDGAITDNRMPVFEWSGKERGYVLLLDDNSEFTSPSSYIASENMLTIPEKLEFGTYWWKIRKGETETPARKLTVVSSVSLERSDGNAIRNSGNTDLNVYRGGLAGAVTLAVNGTLQRGEDEYVIAEQK